MQPHRPAARSYTPRDPALPVPASQIIDTSGAGDVFHGAYIAAYLAQPGGAWADHFNFARGASAYKIQHLGNEAGLPSREDVARMATLYAGAENPEEGQ